MKRSIFNMIFFLLIHVSVFAQYMGGEGAGSKGIVINLINCNFFTSGGAYSGISSNVKLRDFNCNSFFGDSGSGYLSEELQRDMECNMYMGDSVSGYQNTEIKRIEECNMYMGNSHSGMYVEYFFNPSKCLMYTASLNAGSGFHMRALSDDTVVCQLIPLGVDVSPLVGELIDNKAVLTWYTEREYRNSGFELYRSYDGVEWDLITWKSGQGESYSRVDYQHIDKKTQISGQYYRFKQLDFDGGGYYSNIVRLSLDEGSIDREYFTVFPNPTFSTGTLTIKSWNKQVKDMVVEMQDALGRTIYIVENTFDNINQTVNIPVENLNAGTYFIKLLSKDDDMELTLPFVIIH